MEEVAAAERNDAEALERIQRAARGDDDALCDAVAAHLRTELEREAPPPPLDNTNDFPALPTTKKKRVRATLGPLRSTFVRARHELGDLLDQLLALLEECSAKVTPHLPQAQDDSSDDDYF